MPVSTVLALRSILLADPLNDTALAAAARCDADAVALDLASVAAYERRPEVQSAATAAIERLGGSPRQVVARLSDARSGSLAGDVEAVVGPALTAVILAGTEEPQDVRDIDVLVRRQEMRHGIEPGSVRLLPEIDSPAGLMALPRILEAVDRHSGVVMNLDGLRQHLCVGPGADTLFAYAMAQAGITAHAAHLPWFIFAPTTDASASNLASRAHGLGAAGAMMRTEASVRGMNLLFTPDPVAVERARAVVQEWERLRGQGVASGTTHGAIVDRRSAQHARRLLAHVEAIEHREREF